MWNLLLGFPAAAVYSKLWSHAKYVSPFRELHGLEIYYHMR